VRDLNVTNRLKYFLLALAVSLVAWVGIIDAVLWLMK
jgi:hypothetical protein